MAKFIFERPIDDRHDKIVFMGAFGVGMVAILGTRFLGDLFADPTKPLSPFDFLAVLISVTVIVLYTFYIVKTPDRTGISLDRAGDNAYYLGLLFTLLTLVYSLYKVAGIVSGFDVSQVGDEISVRPGNRVIRLLPDFGLALMSTVTGIFCRVLVQQFRDDPADIETQARLELGRAVRELRASLLRAVADINTLSQSTNAATSEMVHYINRTLREAADVNAGTITQVGEGLRQLAGSFTSQVQKISDFADGVMRQIDATSQSMNEATTEMVLHIKKTLEQAAEDNAGTMTRVGKEIGELVQELADQETKISGFAEDVMQKIGTVVAGVNDELSKLVIDPTGVQRGLDALSKELEKVQDQLLRISTSQKNVAQELASVLGQVTSLFPDELASSLRSATNETLRRHDLVTSELENLETEVSETSQRISGLKGDILKTGEELVQTRESSQQALALTATATSEYIDSLTDAAKRLRRATDEKA